MQASVGRSWGESIALASSLITVLLTFGCSAPPTPVSIDDAAKAGLVTAREGCSAGDPKMAEKGARQVETALRDAEARVELLREQCEKSLPEADTPELDDAEALVERIEPLAREARNWADLAEEEKRCAGIVNSLRASAYRTSRKAALLALFQGLALAADQAAKKEPEELPEKVRTAAQLAGDLAGHLGARQPSEEGVHNWPGIAEDMRAFSKESPPNLSLDLACGYVFLRQPRWALCEIEAVDPDALTSPRQRVAYRVLRGIIYRLNACPRMAAREFEQFKDAEGAELGASSGPEIEAGLYLLIGFLHLSDKKLKEADVWFMRAGQAWPNCPLMVFLTGERLNANGEWEKAAESLEASVESEENKWLAEMVARRARQIRDQKGETTPLILDTGFLWDLSWGYLNHYAEKAEPAKVLKEKMGSAKELASEMLSKLPGTKDE